MAEEKPDGIQTPEDGPTKLASCRQRELQAERATGGESYGRRELRAGKKKT